MAIAAIPSIHRRDTAKQLFIRIISPGANEVCIFARCAQPGGVTVTVADRQRLVHLVTACTRLHKAAAPSRAVAYDIENSGVKPDAVMLMARADIAKKCDDAITRLDRAIADVPAIKEY